MDLSGKVALISGGTRMGHAVAQALASKGCSTVLTWRSSRQTVEETVSALKAQGANASSYSCDLARPASLRQLVRHLNRTFGRLEILVNLASVYEKAPLGQGWQEDLDANLTAAQAISLAVLPLMRKSREGRMVHISDWTSASGRPRYKGYSSYYVSKAGIKALVESLALELAPKIQVNSIAPGPILPPKGLTRAEDRAVRQATPLGRWGGPEEIAKAVLFLCETDFVTGETLRVDGGRHLY